MKNAERTAAFLQTRKVSGFSRPMSVWDAFIYNFLAMGVIFPWTYLWSPASFPGGNIEIGIWLAFLAQVPISISYVFLATALPVTGGDYVYQTRAFGKFGAIAVISGFVIWILQWVALSGWLFATLGLAPLLLSLAVRFQNAGLVHAGLFIQTPLGVFLTSLFLAFATTAFLTRGLRNYVRVQRVLFALTLGAVAAVVWIFASDGEVFHTNLDAHVAVLLSLLNNGTPEGFDVSFVNALVTDVSAHTQVLSAPFSWIATLGVVPIAWTSLQWATYSVEQNEEITEADRPRKQLLILLGSAFLVAFLLWLVAHVEHMTLSKEFVVASSASYWLGVGSPDVVSFVQGTIQPFPNVLAMMATGSVPLILLIALGFLANSFQVTCNCFIGVTRILVAMGTDGMLRGLRLEEVDPVRHAPVRAHWAYFAASVPVIAAYSFITAWKGWTLGVTFACGYVFALSALAASQLPTRLSVYWKQSSIRSLSPVLIRTISYIGFGTGAAMVGAYLLVPQLGITGTVPNIIVFVVLVSAYVIVAISRVSSPHLEDSWKNTEVDDHAPYSEDVV